MIWICELPKLKVMHKLSRRIEELERVALAIRRDREAKVEHALWKIEEDQVELVFSSADAEIQGRPFNEAESAARQAYTRALKAECRQSRLWSDGSVKGRSALDIYLTRLAELSDEEFKLAASEEQEQKEPAGCSPKEADEEGGK